VCVCVCARAHAYSFSLFVLVSTKRGRKEKEKIFCSDANEKKKRYEKINKTRNKIIVEFTLPKTRADTTCGGVGGNARNKRERIF
jgi:hypothetical protein